MKEMIQEKTWEEFKATGLLLYINQILHVFGWAITCEVEHGNVIRAYPARCKFRGFDPKNISDSYIKISEWMDQHHNELLNEAKNE